MIKLKNILYEKVEPSVGSKFCGIPQQFQLVKGINEDNSRQSVVVTSKKTGNTYSISKSYYQKHKDKYTVPKKGHRFVGKPQQFEKTQKPKNAQQFKKMFIESVNHKRELYKSKDIAMANYLTLMHEKYESNRNALNNYSANAYKEINKALITGEGLNWEVRYLHKKINETLPMLRSYQGVVQRYIQTDDESRINPYLKVGSILRAKCFVSTTADTQQEEFNRGYFLSQARQLGLHKLQLIIKSKTGKPIRQFCNIKKENQVLFADKTEFQIVDVQSNTIFVKDSVTWDHTYQDVITIYLMEK